jgi:hypothetical protein
MVGKHCGRVGLRHVLTLLCIVIVTVSSACSGEVIHQAAGIWGSIGMVLHKQICPLWLFSTLKIRTFEVKAQ